MAIRLKPEGTIYDPLKRTTLFGVVEATQPIFDSIPGRRPFLTDYPRQVLYAECGTEQECRILLESLRWELHNRGISISNLHRNSTEFFYYSGPWQAGTDRIEYRIVR